MMNSTPSVRLRGKLTQWFEEEGYGLIESSEVEGSIYAARSAFTQLEGTPKLNEIVIFDSEQEVEKGTIARNIVYANRTRPITIKPTKVAAPMRKKSRTALIVMVIFGFLILSYFSPVLKLVETPPKQLPQQKQ